MNKQRLVQCDFTEQNEKCLGLPLQHCPLQSELSELQNDEQVTNRKAWCFLLHFVLFSINSVKCLSLYRTVAWHSVRKTGADKCPPTSKTRTVLSTLPYRFCSPWIWSTMNIHDIKPCVGRRMQIAHPHHRPFVLQSQNSATLVYATVTY